MKQKTELHLNRTQADSPKLPEITKMVENFTKILNQTKRNINGQRISLDINISTKYVYVRKHTHNKNEKATEIMFCECNEN